MCKKHTSVSRGSIESEVTSLGAGLRMDGVPALDIWDLVVEVLIQPSEKLVPHWTIKKTLQRKDEETIQPERS